MENIQHSFEHLDNLVTYRNLETYQKYFSLKTEKIIQLNKFRFVEPNIPETKIEKSHLTESHLK